MKIFITIDTEIWPKNPQSPDQHIEQDIDRDIWGLTIDGEFGIRYQAQLLKQYGLKGIFFVEPLFSKLFPSRYLQEIIDVIKAHGHDVECHIHTEWLKWLPAPQIVSTRGDHLQNFALEEQQKLIGVALQLLQACGEKNIQAFRAGSFGANRDTLIALQHHGIPIDSSYNIDYVGKSCQIFLDPPIFQPQVLEGTLEFPVSYFQDYPGHFRPTQLCACSFLEMKTALLNAWQAGWYGFVIVSHSFELLQRQNGGGAGNQLLPDLRVIKRFTQLCQFLDDHRDKFQTSSFKDLVVTTIPVNQNFSPLKSPFIYTLGRYLEQAWRKF